MILIYNVCVCVCVCVCVIFILNSNKPFLQTVNIPTILFQYRQLKYTDFQK